MTKTRTTRTWLVSMTGGALTSAFLLAAAGPAHADSAPQPPETVSTVTADSLPTMQVNGVVWDQVVVGNTVYAVGQFTASRPAGAAAGSNETSVANAVAYDLTTGVQKMGWIPRLNGAARTVTAAADGSAIYIGGDFTSVTAGNGTFARNRIVSVNPTTGAVNTGFVANANQRVGVLEFSGNTLYAGGAFTSVNNTARQRLAAMSPTTGALTSWAPSADQEIMGIAIPEGTGSVVVAGRLEVLNGVEALGMGAVDIATGQTTLPWEINKQIQNYGAHAAIYSLETKNGLVFGSAYDFYGPSEFEATFAAKASDGAMVWVSGCKGDTYDVVPVKDVLYNVGHAHNCAPIGGHPQEDPWTFQRAQAVTIEADGVNVGGAENGRPKPRLLHWTPTVAMGGFTGQNQGAWTIEGNDDYVVMGGEFPRINANGQQGLTRFAVSSKATNIEGPQGYTELKPTAISLAAGSVRVSWQAAWDRDNRNLTYEVLRGANTNTAKVVAKFTADSNWWDRPMLSFTDLSATPGTTETYRVRVSDSFNNTLVSARTDYLVPEGTVGESAYRDAVLADGATSYWRLGEQAGTTAYDWAGADDLTLAGDVIRGSAGAIDGDADAATEFVGSNGVPGVSTAKKQASDSLTVETWIKTDSTSGGKIVGFGESRTGNSSSYDRHLYMSDDGRITFGVYPGSVATVSSKPGFNDGQWHQVVATLDSKGIALYVDGHRVAREAGVTNGQAYSGYWRVGGDNQQGWPATGSSSQFRGTIDDLAIYGQALTPEQITDHYTKSGRTPAEIVKPSDAYGKAVYDLDPSLFWRLDEKGEGIATVTDSGPNGVDGAVSTNGVTFEHSGALDGDQGTAAQFDNGVVVSTQSVNNPTKYSASVWFKTTTTSGGKLIGFGRSGDPNQTSSNYDRHVYMTGDGKLHFGTYTGQMNMVDSAGSYNDGQWHNVVATQSNDGMVLYVDGVAVGTNPATGAESYTGYWRIGGDSSWQGDTYFDGLLDEAAVFSRALSATEVASLRSAGYTAAPVAQFTAKGKGQSVDLSATESPEAKGEEYSWDFGDGQTGTGQKVTHEYATAGTFEITLTVTNSAGKTDTMSVKRAVPAAKDAYGRAVLDDDPALFWRLDETEGSDVTDSSPYAVGGRATGSFTWGQEGLNGTAAGFDGNGGVFAMADRIAGPSVYSAEAWFKTTSDQGGKILGFGNVNEGTSGNYDRHVYMDGAGHVYFGTWTGSANVAQSEGTFNDGAWHHVVATQGADGMKLYVDGVEVGTNPQTGQQAYDGYWRIGGDSSWAGAAFFNGSIEDFAVYSKVLSADAVAKHYSAVSPNKAPVAAMAVDVKGLSVTVDGSDSSDPDGDELTYSWAYGDGTTDTGVTPPTHTYAEPGEYDIVLTVSDGQLSSSTTERVTVDVVPNAKPTAKFSAATDALKVSVDAKDSEDPDGTIESYAWEFGDGATATGVDAEHTYATAGEYTVRLTVTDNQGATDVAEKTVTVEAANAKPTAKFSAATDALKVSVDAKDSEDPDGTIESYAWEFGDGATATGVAAEHTYAKAGDYTVKLTVTDNKGATDVAEKSVTVEAPPVAPAIASDSFGRTLASGWGSADAGGLWTLTNGNQFYKVSGSAGVQTMSTAGAGRNAYLNSVSATDTDTTVTLSMDKDATGGGVYGTVVARRSTSATVEYRGKVQYLATGGVRVYLSRLSGGVESTLTHVNEVPGLKATPNGKVKVRFLTEGTNPTQLKIKVWDAASAEPTAWLLTTTDSTAALQGPGAVGLLTYASGSLTNAPIAMSFSDLTVADPKSAPPVENVKPTAKFDAATAGLKVSVDAKDSTDSDGKIVAYAWEFGDGATATGVTADHTYDQDGTYTVKLTVTDDKGATGTATKSVTVEAGKPTAKFDAAVTALKVTVDAKGSSVPDGTIESYDWKFGDGATATGVTASHTYDEAGQYTITLTVTDSRGAKDVTEKSVTVAEAPVTDAVASDAFKRTVTGGWGTADLGGLWTLTNGGQFYSVSGGLGIHTLSTAGAGRNAYLNSVSAADVDTTVAISMDKDATGGGTYATVVARRNTSPATSEYRGKVQYLANGGVRVYLSRFADGAETTLTYLNEVPGLKAKPNAQLKVRLQVAGTSPTTLKLKVWDASTDEPSAWQLTTTDSTAALQRPGAVGLLTYVSGSATNAPIAVSFGDFEVKTAK